MTLAAWAGLGAGVLALALVVQTLRLRAAQRAEESALAAVEDGREAIAAAQRRREDDRKVAAAWKGRYQELQDRLHLELAEFEERRGRLETWTDGVRDAAGDDASTLDVLRNVLRVGRPLRQRGTGDSQDG